MGLYLEFNVVHLRIYHTRTICGSARQGLQIHVCDKGVIARITTVIHVYARVSVWSVLGRIGSSCAFWHIELFVV